MNKSKAPLRPPQQQRSQKTLTKILDATEELLRKKTFDQISISEILGRSGVSAGAFYTRFRSKEDVLEVLYDRHQESMISEAKIVLDPKRWADQTLIDIIRTLIGVLVNLYREQTGLYRSLVLQGFIQPDLRYQDPKIRENLIVSKVGQLLSARCQEFTHSKPQLAASLGFLMVLATLREKILFSESTARAVSISDPDLVAELTHAYASYLGVKQSVIRSTAESYEK